MSENGLTDFLKDIGDGYEGYDSSASIDERILDSDDGMDTSDSEAKHLQLLPRRFKKRSSRNQPGNQEPNEPAAEAPNHPARADPSQEAPEAPPQEAGEPAPEIPPQNGQESAEPMEEDSQEPIPPSDHSYANTVDKNPSVSGDASGTTTGTSSGHATPSTDKPRSPAAGSNRDYDYLKGKLAALRKVKTMSLATLEKIGDEILMLSTQLESIITSSNSPTEKRQLMDTGAAECTPRKLSRRGSSPEPIASVFKPLQDQFRARSRARNPSPSRQAHRSRSRHVGNRDRSYSRQRRNHISPSPCQPGPSHRHHQERHSNLTVPAPRLWTKPPRQPSPTGEDQRPAAEVQPSMGNGEQPVVDGRGLAHSTPRQAIRQPIEQAEPKPKPPPNCAICGHLHYTVDCTFTMDAEERVHLIEKNGHCIKCMKHGHLSPKCPFENRQCRRCKSYSHHMAVCHYIYRGNKK